MSNKDLVNTISNWKQRGLKETRERRVEIYWLRESATNCEKCGKEFKSSRQRHMDHCHETGKFRNILCQSCNLKRCKLHSTSTSGYLGICKLIDKKCKQGFFWSFKVHINGKTKCIKSSVDKEFLIQFAKNWKKENHYND